MIDNLRLTSTSVLHLHMCTCKHIRHIPYTHKQIDRHTQTHTYAELSCGQFNRQILATEVDLWGISKHMAFEPGVGEGQLGREKQTVAKHLPSKKWGHLKDKTSLSPRGQEKGNLTK